MTPAQAAAILASIEPITPGDSRLIGWEAKHDPLECNDPVLAAMIDANRVYEIPFQVVAISRRQWQIWEPSRHSGFWKTSTSQTDAALDAGQTTTNRIHNMTNTATATNPAERKAMLGQVCDADSYLPIITACLDEAQIKQLKPRHMANFMALAAELFISNYSMIAEAFERNYGLEVGFKAKLAPERDNVEISFKPVDVFKDSASAAIPNEDQEEFSFVKKPAPVPPAAGPVVEAEVLALPAPAETLALPAPVDVVRSEEEQIAFSEGVADFDPDTECNDNNPYDEMTKDGAPLHQAYADGWKLSFDNMISERCYEWQKEIMRSAKFAEVKRAIKALASEIPLADYKRVLEQCRDEEREITGREWLIDALTEAIAKVA